MALQDIITNLGSSIINLVKLRIEKAFTIHDTELEDILLELKKKIDSMVDSSGGNTGGEVLNVNRVDGETIILTKEYLNKYVAEAIFTEDLQVSMSSQGITTYATGGVTFYTNEANYTVDKKQYKVSATFSAVIDSGGCSLYWDTSTKTIGVVNSRTIDFGKEGTIGLLLIAGTNTTDRDGTNLGSHAFAIGGSSSIVL